jgi:PAS domain S-box-containing protein
MKSGALRTRLNYRTPARLLVVTTVCVFVAEAFIMLLLSVLPRLSTWMTVFLDASLIVACVLPVMYLSLFRPLQRSMMVQLQSEESMRISERKFRSYVGSSPYAVVVVDENGSILDVNDAAKVISGYPQEELLTMNLSHFFPPEEKTMGIEHFSRVVRTGKSSGVVPIVVKSDARKYWEIKAVKLGENRFLGFISDVTARVEVEGALKESEEKYRLIFETAANLITSVDSRGTLVDCNKRIEEVLGYKREEVIGQKMSKIIHRDYLPKAHETLAELIATGITQSKEYKMIRKDGRVIDVNINSSSITNKQGDYVRSICIIDDITETKRLQALESRAARLETAGTIAGQVAHDFNNLLAPLMAYPEFIRDGLPKDSSVRAYLDYIENAAEKMADINQNLLTMGRRGHYNQEVINLNRVVLQAVQEIESRTKTVTCDMKLCEDLMKIKGGIAQIHRALTNLLVNTQDAMQGIGKVTIKTENYYADDTSVAFGCVPKGEYVKLTISDNGCGIPDDIIQNIFDPFFSTKTADKKRGSGLGLSVVDAVMKDHNAYLDLSSKVGHGTSFYLYFPITREDVGENKVEHLAGGTETVLIVDDDEIQRQVTTQLLKKLGYKVGSVESGEKAIEFLRENPQGLVILDMVMPGGIDGAETYRRILEISPHQTAIILSGFSESDRVLEAQKLGAGAFVRKPVTKSVIAAAVRTELDRQVKAVTS